MPAWVDAASRGKTDFVFNTLTFVAFFAFAGGARTAAALDDSQDQPPHRELHLLRRVESAFHPAAVDLNGHLQDYAELQGYDLPDWSHMTRTSAESYTEALYGIIERNYPPADGARW
jgi:hypothetical protein